MFGFEVAGVLREIPIGIDEFDSEVAKLLNARVGVSRGSLTRDDLPDFACVYDCHEQWDFLFVRVGNDVRDFLCRRFVFEIMQ